MDRCTFLAVKSRLPSMEHLFDLVSTVPVVRVVNIPLPRSRDCLSAL